LSTASGESSTALGVLTNASGASAVALGTGFLNDGFGNNIAGATGSLFSVLPPENATGNYVKVVQRIPVKIILEKGQDPEHLLRLGMSVEPKVRVK